MFKAIFTLRGFLKDEKGDISTMSTKVGLGLLSIAIVAALFGLYTGTTQQVWNAMTDKLMDMFNW